MKQAGCRLERSDMPDLVRLRCPCGFYAAVAPGATEAETRRAVQAAAAAQHQPQNGSRFAPSLKELIVKHPEEDDMKPQEAVDMAFGQSLAEQKREANEMAAKAKTEGKPQAAPAPELTDEERQEQKRAKWRAFYQANKAKYAEWGKRWRERQKTASPKPADEPKRGRKPAAKKGTAARDEHGRFIKR